MGLKKPNVLRPALRNSIESHWLARPERDVAMYEVEATAELLLMTGQGQPVIEPQAPEVPAEALLVTAVVDWGRDLYWGLYDTYAPMVHGILLARVPRNDVDALMHGIFLHRLKKTQTL